MPGYREEAGIVGTKVVMVTGRPSIPSEAGGWEGGEWRRR